MRSLGASLLYFFLGTSVFAAQISFSGTVMALCTLATGTDGTLGLSTDGGRLGSQEGLGLPGTVTIVSIGSNNIQVAAPTRTQSPVGYNSSGEQLQVAYTGAGGLTLVNQAYTASTTQFSVGTIALSVLTIQNRILNANGFAPGAYQTQTVVTCLP